jgi:hypothetical protein
MQLAINSLHLAFAICRLTVRACKTPAFASAHACYYNSHINDVVLTNTVGLEYGFHKHARLGFSVASKP